MIKARSVYCIGIGGIGISALAQLLVARGINVQGSDTSTSEVTQRLRRGGIRVVISGSTRSLPRQTDLVIYSPAVPSSHPLRRAARKKGIESLSYPQALWREVEDKRVIAVAGTHGKTTVTSLISWFLVSAGKDPTTVVGAFMLNGNSNARRGRGTIAVIEADEFDRSFLHYRPDVIVINNIEHDHFDTYPTFGSMQQAFKKFIRQRRTNAVLVSNADSAVVQKITPASQRTFGLTAGAYKPRMLKETARGTSFTIKGVQFNSPLYGRHNSSNVAAAVAAATAVGVSVRQCAQALRRFRGTWRRFEVLGTYRNMTVITDYGHHPTELTATIQAVRQRYPHRPLVTVFQPHQHNRTRHLYRKFAAALSTADVAMVTEIFKVTGRLSRVDRNVSARPIATTATAPTVIWAPTFTAIRNELQKLKAKRAIVLCIGAGTIDSFARRLVGKR